MIIVINIIIILMIIIIITLSAITTIIFVLFIDLFNYLFIHYCYHSAEGDTFSPIQPSF